MPSRFRDRYFEAVYDTDRERALAVVRDALSGGVTPEQIVFEVIVPSLDRMLKSFAESFDATLAQHFLASQIAVEVTEEMLPRFSRTVRTQGCIVIGTAAGDFHGLGKRIVAGCLKANMIRVEDLGLNVPPERFVEAALAHDAEVIGISSMMMHTATGENGPLGVRRLLDERSLGGRLRIIVGGAPYRFDSGLYRRVGADAWAENGVASVREISALIREVRR